MSEGEGNNSYCKKAIYIEIKGCRLALSRLGAVSIPDVLHEETMGIQATAGFHSLSFIAIIPVHDRSDASIIPEASPDSR